MELGCEAAQLGMAGLARGETRGVNMTVGKGGAQGCWAWRKSCWSRRSRRVGVHV